MPEQNAEKQNPRTNPTRNNRNVLNQKQQDQENEKRFGNERNIPRRPEVNPGELDKKEIDLDSDESANQANREGLELVGDENESSGDESPRTYPPEEPGQNQVRQ